MSWDISPNQEQEYFEFVVREFLPGIQRLGLELSDAWATAYGPHPQILVSAILPSLLQANTVLGSDSWIALNDQLKVFVQNYSLKIVEARSGFQF